MLAAKKAEQIRTFQRGVLPFLVILGPIVALIFLEPNLSMALLVAILAGVVLFTAGVRLGHLLLPGGVGTPPAFGAVASAPDPSAPAVPFPAPGRAAPRAASPGDPTAAGIRGG